MQRLWNRQDYVAHLGHPNPAVRQWALEALDSQFYGMYTPEVSRLIGDPDEYLARDAAEYLARHKAREFAPRILSALMDEKEGLLAQHYLSALGDMGYGEALDNIIGMIPDIRDVDDMLEVLGYLSRIRNGPSHEALLDLFFRVDRNYEKGRVAEHLLLHGFKEDVSLVLHHFFPDTSPEIPSTYPFRGLLRSAGAGGVLLELDEGIGASITKDPEEAFRIIQDYYPALRTGDMPVDFLCQLIKGPNLRDVATFLWDEARKKIHGRFPDGRVEPWHREVFEQDTVALAFLADFSRRPVYWELAGRDSHFAAVMVLVMLSCHAAILGRESILDALAPNAGENVLLRSLETATSEFPAVLQDRIVELAPVQALKDLLAKGLSTWGGVWTVQIMGRIGHEAFLPDLLRVIRESDPFDYPYSDAETAVQRLDESAHEDLFRAIRDGEAGDLLNAFIFLEKLPYAEAFDLAVHLWENGGKGEVEEEIYASCLEGIGDARGIEVLQAMVADRGLREAAGPLEILAAIHGRDIPEMPELVRHREENRERIRKFMEANPRHWNEYEDELGVDAEDDDLDEDLEEDYEDDRPIKPPPFLPFRREKPKVGRNDPCPCGSGKKYKKCCLEKETA